MTNQTSQKRIGKSCPSQRDESETLAAIHDGREDAECIGCTHAAIDLEFYCLCDIATFKDQWDIQTNSNGIFWFRVSLPDDYIMQAVRLHLEWLNRPQ